jgi:hypothetical protein
MTLSYDPVGDPAGHHPLGRLAGSEFVPVESLRCGDPITDLDGGGHCYKVLECRAVDSGGVVMELQSRWDGGVVERSFPAGYVVGRSLRPFL